VTWTNDPPTCDGVYKVEYTWLGRRNRAWVEVEGGRASFFNAEGTEPVADFGPDARWAGPVSEPADPLPPAPYPPEGDE
jgi:hypothetical protein